MAGATLFPFVDGRQGTWNNADAIARAMRAVHEIADLDLPRTDMDEWCIQVLGDRRDHPGLATVAVRSWTTLTGSKR